MSGIRGTWVAAACLAVVVLAAGCQTTGPGAQGQKNEMYVGPAAARYERLIIEPVEVTFDPTSKDIEAKPQEVADLKKYMHDALVKEVSKKYKVVESPGSGVMRVQMTITDVKKGEPLMHLHWIPKLLNLGLGGATLQGDVTDSMTGGTLASGFMSKKGEFFQLTAGLTKWGEAKSVMDAWAREFRKKLDEVHDKA